MIGDYGLSKAIQTGLHSGQTITVGTVHYMAPEIGGGCYDRSIDIYALGILLYEMLIGQVPYFGASPAEILMKHLTAEPDLDQLSEPFAGVVRKALAKDPNERYQTVQEMVEDIFGVEHIRNSVSHFSPESLSVIAQHAAQKARIATASPGGAPAKAKAHDSWESRLENFGKRVDQIVDKVGRKIDDAIDSKTKQKVRGAQLSQIEAARLDPMDRRQRRNLTSIAIVVVALGVGMLRAQGNFGVGLYMALLAGVMIGGATQGIVLSRFRWLKNMGDDSATLRNLAGGGVAVALALLYATIVYLLTRGWDGGPLIRSGYATGTWFALGVVLCLGKWWKRTSPLRSQRVSLGSAIGVGLFGYIAAAIFDGDEVLVAGVLAGAMLAVQILVPYIPAANRAAYAASVKGASPMAAAGPRKQPGGAVGNAQPRMARHGHGSSSRTRLIPPWVRLIWLIVFALALGLGLVLLIAAGIGEFRHEEEFAIVVALGIVAMLLSLFCLFRVFCRTFTGWYRYLIKPVLLLSLMASVLISSMFLGCTNLGGQETIVALLFIILPGILFLVVAFVPSRVVTNAAGRVVPPTPAPQSAVSPYKRIWALLMSGGILLGICGLQRFYVGKIGTGILWLLTFGLLGIGQIIDIIMIIAGSFRDKDGRVLLIWESKDELQRPPTPHAAPAADIPDNAEESAPPYDQHEPPAEPPSDYQPPATDSGSIIQYPPAEPIYPFAVFLSILGNIFLLMALLVGLAAALHVPAMLAVVPELAGELDEAFGYRDWPGLMERLGFSVAVVLLLVALTFKIIARRRAGAAHIMRAALGLLGLLGTLAFLGDAVPKTYSAEVVNMLTNQQIGPALETLLRQTREEAFIYPVIFFVVSIIILAWPPRRRQPNLAAAPAEGA